MNILDNLKNQFQGESLQDLSNMLGESEGNTKTAINSMLPVLLGSILSQATSSTGTSKILDFIKKEDDSGTLAQSASSVLNSSTIKSVMNSDSSMLISLLGPKMSQILSVISGLSGLKNSSLNSLLRMLMPLVLGTINRAVKVQGGDPKSTLQNIATSQIGLIRGALPTSLSNLIDVSTTPKMPASTINRVRESILPSWATLAGLAALILGCAYLLSRAYTPKVDYAADVNRLRVEADNQMKKAQQAGARASVDLAMLAGNAAKGVQTIAESVHSIRLPDGAVVSVPVGNFADKFASLIGNPNEMTESIAFDSVNFEPSSAKLTPNSNQQLSELAAILKAYPQSTIKVTGHTDNTGDEIANQQLSLNRANSVQDYLALNGIDRSRVMTEGQGDDNPVASNLNEEGRNKNRRIEVTLMSR